jgi:hypothetical protein
LAFILFNLVVLPLVGITGARVLPVEVIGAPQPPYDDMGTAVGQGEYSVGDEDLSLIGPWETARVPAEELGAEQDITYGVTQAAGARYELRFNGQEVEVVYSLHPQGGLWAVELDGQSLADPDTGGTLLLDGYNPTVRYSVRQTFRAPAPGVHVLSVINSGNPHPEGQGTMMTVSSVEVLPPIRQSNLPLIIGLIAILELVGILFALALGRPLFSGLAASLDTRRSIILALTVYAVIAVWGFFLNSVIEFWLLAWMVAIVQGGSQALSRSLYASMSPAAKSGEFFGLYGVMEKFSAIIGPLLFALAAAVFDSSRPAVLSLIVLFLVGIFLLTRVDVEEGRRVAREEDARSGLD